MKKNCYNCKHLEWVNTESECGFDCASRHLCPMPIKAETKLLDNLEKEEYRDKAKVCCDLRTEIE